MKLNLPIITQEIAPASEPLTLAEAKTYLRVDGADDDALISNLIIAARREAEGYTRRSLITQSWKMSYNDYSPCEVKLFYLPVQSITSVSVIARDNTQNIVDANLYYLSAGNEKLIFDAALIAHRVEIIYVAGFGDASLVPDGIKQGMLCHVVNLYENRGENLGLSADSKSLYDNYRIVKI